MKNVTSDQTSHAASGDTESRPSHVLMVGTWHLGSVIGACLAEAGHQVSLWDQTAKVKASWSQGKAPIHEPGLDELVKKHWGTRLHWAGEQHGVAKKADWIVLAYDTPINEQDEVLLDEVDAGLFKVIEAGFPDHCHFFFTSQLPVGTSRRYRQHILEVNPRWQGSVMYQPENLRLGEAIKSFTAPDRMVLGVDRDNVGERQKIAASFQTLLNNPKTQLNIMGLESAEMVKHALNSFLATCVVFANEIAEICEQNCADAWDVVASLKQDTRVGPKAFLRPGLGFSGGTLARDVKTLSKLSQKKGAANFFTDLYAINTMRNDWIINHLVRALKDLNGKRIVLLGVTYKPFTSTVRRSPALDIAKLLHDAKAECVALDPMADLDELTPTERKDLPFTLTTNAEEAFKGANAAVVVTEWPQFKELPWGRLKELMKNTLIIDSKNHLTFTEFGGAFSHVVPGKPSHLL